MAVKLRQKKLREHFTLEELDRWTRRNREAAPVVIARAALRVLPLTYEIDRNEERDIALLFQAFRAGFISWGCAKYNLSAQRIGATAVGALDKARHDVGREGKPPVADAAAHALARAVEAHLGRRPQRLNGALYAVRNIADKAATFEFLDSIMADMRFIDSHKRMGAERLESLVAMRLWIDDVRREQNFRVNFPIWAREPWDVLKRRTNLRDLGFDFWFRWYESLLSGRETGLLDRKLSTDAEKNVTRKIVRMPAKGWTRPFAAVNADIKAMIEEAVKGEQALSPPRIPAVRPAAIEPQWKDGKLTVFPTLDSDLDTPSLLAALEALRADMAELAEEANTNQNIDHRPAEYLRRLADRIPEDLPSQSLLFRLGHAHEVLADLARATDAEWPDLLAARYRKLVLQYERVVRQFPKWRAFVRNANEQSLSAEQISDVPGIVESIADELQSEDAKEFIDPIIPDALLATRVPIVSWSEAIDAGNEQLAEDLIESVNNVLKRTVELSLALKSAGIDPVVDWVGTTARRSVAEFGKESTKSIAKEFGKLGKATGPALGRFLKRIAKGATYTGVGGGGVVLLLHRLITLYPDTFGWLEAALKFLHLF